MSRWHLYDEYRNGVNTGGRIQYVWLFGIVGFFVLLLACINFMNLSTARSETRSREVGIRKAIGSLRGQLISQFLCESTLMALLAFVMALLLTSLTLPYFNTLAGKTMQTPLARPLFWVLGIALVGVTGLVAGSYPAFYLSSFRPVKVLKGVFKAGPWAVLPRRILTITQFAVSVILIIGTIVVFRQIEFARNRPLGYDLNGVVMMHMVTSDIHDHFDAVKSELLRSGVIRDMSESGAYITDYAYTSGGYQWRDKAPHQESDFLSGGVGYGYGTMVGWQFIAGRDFSKQHVSDSSGLVINEVAATYMGLKNPVGEAIEWYGKRYTVIGVIRNPMVESPYAALRPYIIHLLDGPTPFVVVRLNPQRDPHEALAAVERVFRKFNPSQPFDYHFADTEYNEKFGNEERIGALTRLLAGLAIFISCLGLFGMASFLAEQRVKEIGVRKVLGASVFNLWRLLSKEFVVLVSISLTIAIPVAWLLMRRWLANYTLHADLKWWIFAVTALAALLITLATVSYQSIKAALANPVASLRSE
jgi:putative ABC transport system permease protein